MFIVLVYSFLFWRLALVAETIPDLQKAVNLLSIWVQTNEIKINEEKRELVIFRKGGKVAESESYVQQETSSMGESL